MLKIKSLLKKAYYVNNIKVEKFNKNKKRLKVGVMGGTFNPIHNAHLLVAQCAKENYSLDKVVFIPTGNPPHKKTCDINSINRYEMVILAIMDNDNFLCLDFEIKKEGYSYTYDTLKYLKEFYDIDLYFIVGADSIYQIETWKNFEKNFELSSFIASTRLENINYEDRINYLNKKYNANILISYTPRFDISSTMIRENIKNKKSIKYIVPDNVKNYIFYNNLYAKGE